MMKSMKTFTAALILGKIHEESRHLYHTGVAVHDNEAAGTDHSAHLFQRIKVQTHIKMRGDETAAGRPADLHRLKFRISLDAAADIKDNFLQCRSHRHFNETGVLHTSGQGKRLGSRTLLRPDGLVPGAPLVMIIGTLAKVSTLLSTVGFAKSPCSTVRGGFTLGMPRFPSIDAVSALPLAADKGSRAPVNM